MSHCQGDAVWGAPSCAGQWTLPLCSVVQYQDISTACNTTVSGLRSIWALDSCWIPLLSGDCVSPDPVFLFFFLVLLLPLCPTMRMGPIQFHCVPLSLELGHLSPCIYWLTFWCQLANLERNWSYLCQTVKGAVITRRNGIFGSWQWGSASLNCTPACESKNVSFSNPPRKTLSLPSILVTSSWHFWRNTVLGYPY